MNQGNLNGKNVLMFCVKFFDYREQIAQGLRDLGCNVDLYDERPKNDVLTKTMVRYNIGLIRPSLRKYYRQIIAQNQGKHYDYVFVVKGEVVNGEILSLLRSAYPDAKFILYLWDSVKNIPDCANRIRLYDRALTFDPVDAKQYGMVFRPLFFSKAYETAPEPSEAYAYDVAFIGTAHSDRPRIVKALEAQCEARGGACFHYLFLPHKLVYLYNKVLNRDYRHVEKRDIHFTSISAREIREVYQKSRCILDVEHKAQRGLTMRTIEMVGMGKKLITTNQSIRDYDFYDPRNICVIDRQEPVVDEAFWRQAYAPLPPDILRRYSLQAFLEDIFDMNEGE